MERSTIIKEKLSHLDYSIAGAVSGAVARFVGQPLDVLKIRFQVQNFKDGGLKYGGILKSVNLIFKEEGLTAFWKGHVSAQGLSIIYGAVQFTTYEHTKRFYSKIIGVTDNQVSWNPVINFLSGGNGGMMASFISQPLDVIRTRTVMQFGRKRAGLVRLIRSMIAENGVKTFYKGAIPNLLAMYPYCGFSFLFYGLAKELWTSFELPNTRMKALVCGCVSGTLAKLLLLPFDNVKKRLQMNGSKNFEVTYIGMVDCFQTVFREQGLKALYRGVSPAVLKAAVVTGMTFFVYEETCILLASRKTL